jgi:hypothetical protein
LGIVWVDGKHGTQEIYILGDYQRFAWMLSIFLMNLALVKASCLLLALPRVCKSLQYAAQIVTRGWRRGT